MLCCKSNSTFLDFMSSGRPAKQASKLISVENYFLSKLIFKMQINVSHQRKSFKPKDTLLGIPKMLCWKSLILVLIFYKQGKLLTKCL